MARASRRCEQNLTGGTPSHYDRTAVQAGFGSGVQRAKSKLGECLRTAAEVLIFEKAARLRDQIKELKHLLDGTKAEARPVS